ncbi:hypothetical protein E0H59_18340 [Rhizobium leguminosarum bv. viciae]|uniref:nSTAND1 domain-containing NTPase n=1 Tax=Rhizobium ruizarguesonis TaxID=2081791 RepID=UPI00103924E8|nr:hypothetical protein [Rhizobium ruizarguesonis]MBY5806086.1 hypothetical protein [Rhizobium leguminosarum]TBY53339.1 hypothetical protein E0H59_18340 [Rhizobium leguminosarum bv. viciae]MBY5846876.1 hypothetical protein [Rhizobium leguminosarum]NEH87949.1 hypothetical protein [Rhizobium ruizarguesonis]NEJ58088.1 hypothetical protein [Rhizobium ruizarguesonis]
MDIVPLAPAEPAIPAAHAEIFIRRWQAWDRSCFPKAAGILITTPYPGLRSFRRELARFFCGRDMQKQELKTFFVSPRIGTAGRMTFVVGGSGSGKSSLTRAGLIAELDSLPLNDQWGAWYVAETRPATDPIGQLQNAIWKVVRTIIDLAYLDPDADPEPKGDFPERAAAEKAASIRVASARIRSVALDLGMEWPENAHKDFVERAAKRWLDREISPSDGTISTQALFDFVGNVLAEFDAAASYGSRGGKPLLLLHIDQFEEIFRNECDAEGRKALIGLLRDIHEYKPECLFAVATMRSEELHRFSEYAGMSEVINSSMYLVDLVGNDDIESAIVEPAWRLARLWELPLDASASSRTAPYTAEAVIELKAAYREAGEILQHKADKLPLLQHFLPLVWVRAVDDWIARRDRDKTAVFEIGVQHLAMVPGWAPSNSSDLICRLGRCLNDAAGNVFKDAEKVMTAMARERGFDGSEEDLRLEANGILSVALCCLAQLDEGGRAVRKFVSIEDMLATCAGAVRLGTSPSAKQHLRTYLTDAFKKFDEAGLVELLPTEETEGGVENDVYNVTHESLIRNWTDYRQHLELQKRLEQRLSLLAVQELRAPGVKYGGLLDRLFHKDWEAANTLIPSESQETMRLLFGSNSRYSIEWATKVLIEKRRQLAAIGDSSEVLADPEKRIGWIERLWNDAVKWRAWGSKWAIKLQLLVVWGGAALLFLAIVAVGALMNAQQLSRQLNLALAANDLANSTAPRNAADDRALSWLIDTVKKDYGPGLGAKQLSILRKTIGNIDKGSRAIYGADVAISFVTTPPTGTAEPADCRLVVDSQKRIGFVPAKFRLPSRIDENKRTGPAGVVTTLECGTKDEDWFFRLDLKRPDHAPGNDDPKKLEAYLGLQRLNTPTPLGIRGPLSTEGGEQMSLLLLDADFRKNMERVDRAGVKFIRSGPVVGFLIPRMGPKVDGQPSDVYLWSTTGLADPVALPPGTNVNGKKACESYEEQPAGATASGQSTQPGYRMCKVGAVNLDTRDKELVIYRSADDPEKCPNDHSQCQNTIEIRYQGDGGIGPGTGSNVRTRIVHAGPKIIDAGVDGDWLWIEDVEQKKWNYLVGTEPLRSLLAMRWRQLPPGSTYRIPETCKEIHDCRAFMKKRTGDWPGVAE